jgi:Lrp/AsnC family transcriptional regulator, leucine-responsive regulatory protein
LHSLLLKSQNRKISNMIDETDRAILRALERDGRISNTALADKIGLSQSACLRRMQALEETGVITGYRAVLDRAKVGGGLKVYVAVGLSRHLKADQIAFERAMLAAREVRECHNVSGTIEYMLHVEVADLAAYKHFHTDVLGTVEQVASITSYFVMGSPKDERG